MIEEIKKYYTTVFENELLKEINQVATVKEVPAGFELIKAGSFITTMP